MCIDRLVREKNDKEREDKLAQKKGPKVNYETGEIELRYDQTCMPEDFYLITRREEPKEIIKLDWDYNGWKKSLISADSYTQHDWNQTLITRINQVSATIRKHKPIGQGARYITINPIMLPLLQDLVYFTESNGVYTLSGRYLITLDVNMPEDEINVYSDMLKGKVNLINYIKKPWLQKIKEKIIDFFFPTPNIIPIKTQKND